MSKYASDPDCNGLCMTASDVGVDEYGDMIAYAHSSCPAHGSPTDEAKEAW